MFGPFTLVKPFAFDHPDRMVAGRFDDLTGGGEGDEIAVVVVFVGLDDPAQLPLSGHQVVTPNLIVGLNGLNGLEAGLRRDRHISREASQVRWSNLRSPRDHVRFIPR